MIIDVEHHFRVAGKSKNTKVERGWNAEGKFQYSQASSGADVDEHLQFMDNVGIDMAILTGNLVDFSQDAVTLWNDTCAKAIEDHPDRFIGFACVDVTNATALEELDRAVNDLGMKGVHISARPAGEFLDSRKLWPFYEKAATLNIPIDIHVETFPAGYDALEAPYILSYVMAREFDITAAVLRVCFGGVLEDFPALKIIFNHFGGGISALKERMDYYEVLCGDETFRDKPLISKPWQHYFDKLYFNMAGRGPGINTLKCVLTCIRPEKLMFGSDWPPNFEGDEDGCKRYIDDVKNLDMSKNDIDAMLGGNAATLVGLED
ncbi:MAG: amidohydrolase family protein [Rhodospirillales bacterium]|jgi:aminocarboxymuconate-semialdehyde decarboxylase|nr:amidohydrolase family protein [Rhodospirillales bacterium]MDP7601215.1 amidohydrolase family protein [Rhodospirillales bacterium]|tara:strand:- start:19 stop:978 length:960 start_codon:yes stop_codon:yes gene_type:complete